MGDYCHFFSSHKTTKSVNFNKCFNNYGFLIILWYIFLQIFLKPFLSGSIFSSYQSLCLVWLCNPMDCSTPGFPVHHQLPELTQTHVRRVGPTILSSVIPFSSCLQSFPASGSFPVSQFFTSGSHNLEFQLQHHPSDEYSGLISFRMDWLAVLAVPEASL